jgi:glycosyltransferase involved in cell wall biosynthesis
MGSDKGPAPSAPAARAQLVSIGLPVYNGGRYIAQTLTSLLEQDYEELELVISDNGSTDETEEICRSAAARDRRVRYHRQSVNRGASFNYNRVLALARGELFKWAAADDLCAPSLVGRCVEALDGAGGEVVLAYPRSLLIDGAGSLIGPLDDEDLHLPQRSAWHRLDHLLQHRVEWHPVFGVIRTAALRSTRGIGAFPSADIAVLAELCLRGRFAQVPERLFLRRYHDERSIVAGPSFAEQAAWYDPRHSGRGVMPQARLVRELHGAVRRSPLDPADAAMAHAVVLRRWGVPHIRAIAGELRMAAGDEIRRAASRRWLSDRRGVGRQSQSLMRVAEAQPGGVDRRPSRRPGDDG